MEKIIFQKAGRFFIDCETELMVVTIGLISAALIKEILGIGLIGLGSLIILYVSEKSQKIWKDMHSGEGFSRYYGPNIFIAIISVVIGAILCIR